MAPIFSNNTKYLEFKTVQAFLSQKNNFFGAPTRGNECLFLLLTGSNNSPIHNAKDYKLYSLNSDMFGLVIPVTLDKWRLN